MFLFSNLGNASKLYESVHEKIFSLPSEFLLYPGHDYQGIVLPHPTGVRGWWGVRENFTDMTTKV